VLQQALVV